MNGMRNRVKSIFLEALEHWPPERWDAFLDEACRGEPDVRERVRVLLDAHQGADSLIDHAGAAAMASVDDAPTANDTGTVIGPYRLMEQIGEGGMGVVYVAEQSQPVRRRVALKLIKPGMDTRRVIARFEAERQALAMMGHPNIARVIDAGAAESGRPYFVMELVRGIPITEYCDRETLSIRDRLELFVLVCRAVQHAHQKGIIHRDLKPSNILITIVDGVPVPKVIDFGVAKATGGALTDRTLYTGFHQFVGTPLYMSPEQADLSGADVDTRSDVYGLGVLLYELLTGTTPFDEETIRRAAFDELRRMIREVEPPKPSTRLSTLGATRTAVSVNRRSDVRRLDRTVRGDLDWIVMKALEKDRRRRYDTANDFAADVMRYLTEQPVEACPPTAWYRFSKYARRNRTALSTAAFVLLAMAVGTGLSVWQAVRATAAERSTVAALHRADEHFGLARQTLEFYEEAIERWSLDLGVQVRGPFLETALSFYRICAESRRGDADEAHVNVKLAETLDALGRRGVEAQDALRRAEVILSRLLKADPNNIECRRDLARCLAVKSNVTGNFEYFLDGFRVEEAIAALRPDVPLYRKNLALTLRGLGANNGDRPKSKAYLDRCRSIVERLISEDPGDLESRRLLSELESCYGVYLQFDGLLEKGELHLRQSYAIIDQLLGQHPTLPRYWHQMYWAALGWGELLVKTGRSHEARAVLARAVATVDGLESDYPGLYGVAPSLPYTLAMLASAQIICGRRAEADATLRRLEKFAPAHSSTVAWNLLWDNAPENWAEALTFAKRGAEVENPPEIGFTSHVLGMALYRVERWDDAIAALIRANEWYHKRKPDYKGGFAWDQNTRLGYNGFFLAMACQKKRDRERARAWFDRSVALAADHTPGDEVMDPFRAEAAALLGIEPRQEEAKVTPSSPSPE